MNLALLLNFSRSRPPLRELEQSLSSCRERIVPRMKINRCLSVTVSHPIPSTAYRLSSWAQSVGRLSSRCLRTFHGATPDIGESEQTSNKNKCSTRCTSQPSWRHPFIRTSRLRSTLLQQRRLELQRCRPSGPALNAGWVGRPQSSRFLCLWFRTWLPAYSVLRPVKHLGP